MSKTTRSHVPEMMYHMSETKITRYYHNKINVVWIFINKFTKWGVNSCQVLTADEKRKTYHYALSIPTAAPNIALAVG